MKMISIGREFSNSRRGFYLIYTLAFAIVASLVFMWFAVLGHSLIWQSDGWNQHYRALIYYGRYLRNILKTLFFEHTLRIPQWDFYLGEGNDILNTLHYYVIGDPIAALSVFIPVRYMQYYFTFSCILRLYLAGIAFTELCLGTGIRNRWGILTAALSYCFCMWGIYTAARHPYFLNPMMYFPLLILGIEKILRGQRPYCFIAAAFLSAISNFYFFYMIAVLGITYGVVRTFVLHRNDIRMFFVQLMKLGGYAVAGVGCACIVLLPVLTMFLQDSRIGEPQPVHLFYPLSYYSVLPSVAVSSHTAYWLCMGFTAPVMLAVFLLCLNKRDGFLKMLVGICLMIILCPMGGRLMNGMGYMTNRWSWAFALLCTYICARKWDELVHAGRSEWARLVCCVLGYYVVCLLFDKSRNAETFISLGLMLTALLWLKAGPDYGVTGGRLQLGCLAIAAVNLVSMGFWAFSQGAGNYASQFKPLKELFDEVYNNEAEYLKNAAANEAYPRYTGSSITTNANMINGISSTQYYWSNANPYMNQYRQDLEMREESDYYYFGYDDRTAPIALSATKYYITKEKGAAGVPYGFSRMEEKKSVPGNDKYDIYINDLALPLGYTYDSWISEDTWKRLNPVQKQEVQLESICLDHPAAGVNESAVEGKDYTLPFSVKCNGKDILQEDNCFVATQGNTSAVISFEGRPDSETYLEIKGLEFYGTPEYDLYHGGSDVDPAGRYGEKEWKKIAPDKRIAIRKDKLFSGYLYTVTLTLESSAKAVKKLTYKSPDQIMASGRHDYIVNLGYQKDPVTSIRITFPARGRYLYNELNVLSVPMDGMKEKTGRLRENALEDVCIRTDEVTGRIRTDRTRVLCAAIPYSTGWSAWIDSTPADVYKANGHYLGVVVPEGQHTVCFRYGRPYGKAGICLSVLALLAVIGIVIFEEKYRIRE